VEARAAVVNAANAFTTSISTITETE